MGTGRVASDRTEAASVDDRGDTIATRERMKETEKEGGGKRDQEGQRKVLSLSLSLSLLID